MEFYNKYVNLKKKQLDILKKSKLIVFTFIFLLACTKKKDNVVAVKNNLNIDTLLSKVDNYKIDEKKRIEYADKVSALLKSKENDSLIRSYYFKLSDCYYNLQENQKNIEVCRIVYKMSQISNDTLGVAKAQYYIGDYHYSKFDNDSAYYYYTQAEKTYFSNSSKQDISQLKYNKANILFYEKDFLGCEIAIIEVLKKVKHSKNTRLIHDCYITLANALDGLNDSEKALEYYNKAFDMTNQLQQDPQYLILKAQAYNYMGKVYEKQEKHKQAIAYFKKGLAFDDLKTNLPFLYANLINNLAYSKFKTGDKTALEQLKEALQIRESIKYTPGIVSSKINLSEYHLAQNDTIKALAYANEARLEAHNNKIFEDELKALQLLARIDPKRESVYDDRFIKLTDSLQSKERATRNKYARIEFETEEITNQKNDIEAERNRISSQRWIILGFSLFLILISILAYITKLQHTKNKELQFEKDQQIANEEIYQLMLDQQNKIDEGRQKEKKRISQELHDGVMSKLTSTRLNLFILSKKTDEETIKKCLMHIEGIQNIEKEIRSISHDLAQDIFSGKDSFKTIVAELFEQQKTISNVDCHLEIEDKINWDTIESTTKMNLYRIFQEALQNIHKYAKAKNIVASITKHNDTINVDITDDGVGFDVKKLKEGIGLKNMYSRIKTVQGTIDIESKIGKGTHINLIIPI
jgi:signal transduction histidine kinase